MNGFMHRTLGSRREPRHTRGIPPHHKAFTLGKAVLCHAEASAAPAPMPQTKVALFEEENEAPAEPLDDDFPPPPDDEFVASPTVAPKPEPEPELELVDPRINLGAVQRAWPQFLAQAQKISMKTSVMMQGAVPVAVEGKTVVLSFSARMNYDMMNAPKQQEFVRKLLARVLAPDLETLPLRFVLDENAPPPPQRAIARQLVRRDPMAEVEALSFESVTKVPASDAPLWTPPAPAPRVAEASRSQHYDNKKDRQPEPAPPPDLSAELRALDPEVAAAAKPGSHKAQALSELLVQEILSTFGGEIVEG